MWWLGVGSALVLVWLWFVMAWLCLSSVLVRDCSGGGSDVALAWLWLGDGLVLV